jgi:hypothetical protein
LCRRCRLSCSLRWWVRSQYPGPWHGHCESPDHCFLSQLNFAACLYLLVTACSKTLSCAASIVGSIRTHGSSGLTGTICCPKPRFLLTQNPEAEPSAAYLPLRFLLTQNSEAEPSAASTSCCLYPRSLLTQNPRFLLTQNPDAKPCIV